MHGMYTTEVTNPPNRNTCAYKLGDHEYGRDDLMVFFFKLSFILFSNSYIFLFPKGEKFLETIKSSVQQKKS